MRLSYEQARAFDLLKRPDPHGDPKTAEAIGGETWADNYTVWVNHQTAKALERRGLIRIARDEEWTIYLTAPSIIPPEDAAEVLQYDGSGGDA